MARLKTDRDFADQALLIYLVGFTAVGFTAVLGIFAFFLI